MGYLIILLSNLGAILLYFIVKDLFKNKTTALYTAVLYIFLPARLAFFPILNTVSPVLTLFSLFLFVKFLDQRKDYFLFMLGVSLYLVFIFDPLALSAGIVFAAILYFYWREARIAKKELAKIVLIPALTFGAANYLVFLITKFDALGTFPYIINEARSFNLATHRSYPVWVIQNLIDFGSANGIAQSTLLFALFLYFLMNCKKIEFKLFGIGSILTIAALFLLLLLDLFGISRGEVYRLWIFVMVFFQIIAAHYAVNYGSKETIYLIMISNLIQAAVMLAYVGFVIPV